MLRRIGLSLGQSLGLSLGGLLLLGASPLQALDRTWIGGNVDWLDGGSAANWNPADEPDADDVAIFNTNNAVTLGSNNSIVGLTMSASVELDVSTFTLTVDGLTQLPDQARISSSATAACWPPMT